MENVTNYLQLVYVIKNHINFIPELLHGKDFFHCEGELIIQIT